MNNRLMLPNKFFDFVQARLALVFSTAVETDQLINRYDLGRVVPGFGVDDLVATLETLGEDEIARCKQNTDAAAKVLTSAEDERVEQDILERLLAGLKT